MPGGGVRLLAECLGMSGSSRVVGGEDGDGVGGVAGQVAPGAVIALSGAGLR